MTPLKIGIVEDELIVGKSIFAMLKKIGYAPLKAVRTYEDAVQMLQTESPDLLLIDIMLEGKRDGIELAALVNEKFGIPFIFLTANSDEATVNRAKQVKPFAYLVKPFYENDLFSSIEIAFENYNSQKSASKKAEHERSKFTDSIFIKEGTAFSRVKLSDILYIETSHVYLNIYTSDKQYMARTKLEDFVENYPDANLIRIHRSYAVNAKSVESINDASVSISGKKIPMNQVYKAELLARFNRLS